MQSVHMRWKTNSVWAGPGWVGSSFFYPYSFLFLNSVLSFDLGLQIDSNKLLIICKIENKILGHYETYFMSKINTQDNLIDFWPIGPYINIFLLGFLRFKFKQGFIIEMQQCL